MKIRILIALLGSSLYAFSQTTPDKNVPNVCAGGTISNNFTVIDTRQQDGNYRVQIIKAIEPEGGTIAAENIVATIRNVGTYVTTSGGKTVRNAQFKVPVEVPVGTYKLIYFNQSDNSVRGFFSNNFTISAAATATLSGDATIAYGKSTKLKITFTGGSPWSFDFYDYNSGKTISVTTSTNPYYIDVTPPSNAYYWDFDIKNFKGNCGDGITSGSATITVTPLTITTGKIAMTNICPGRDNLIVPFTVDGTPPSGTNFLVQLAKPGSDQFESLPTTGTTSPLTGLLPKSLSPGENYRVRIISDNYYVQTGPAVSITLTRSAPPKVSNVAFCPGNQPGQLSADGMSLIWYDTNDNGKPLSGAPIPPNDRSSVYYVTQTLEGCESTLARIEVTMKSKPGPPRTSDLNACHNTTASPLTAEGQNLHWFDGNGNPINGTPTPSTNNTGDQIYYVSLNDGCESDRAKVTVHVNPIPAAPQVSNPAETCQFITVNRLSANGEALRWYTQATGGEGRQEAPIPDVNTAGTQSFWVTQQVKGCESPRASISQVVKEAPTKPNAEAIGVCINDGVKPLTAAGNQLRWYTQKEGGSSSAIAPTYTTESEKTLFFYVTQTGSNGCESLRQEVKVSVKNRPPAPEVTPSQFLCQFGKAEPLKAGGQELQWQGPGVTNPNTAPSPPTETVQVLQYKVLQRKDGCPGPESTISVTVRKVPDPPGLTNAVVAQCKDSPAQALTAIGEQLKWYRATDDTGKGSGSSESQAIPPTNTGGTINYYVSQTDNNGCESKTSKIDVRILVRATARLTGDSLVFNPQLTGDSTAIRLWLTGDGPWKVQFWNRDTETDIAAALPMPYVKWERPAQTTTYKLKSVRTDCGAGEVLNEYRLMVQQPLAVPAQLNETVLKAYPNPTTGDVNVEWSAKGGQMVTLQILSTTGIVVWETTRRGNGTAQTDKLSLGNQPIGVYHLRLILPQTGMATRSVIRQ